MNVYEEELAVEEVETGFTIINDDDLDQIYPSPPADTYDVEYLRQHFDKRSTWSARRN